VLSMERRAGGKPGTAQNGGRPGGVNNDSVVLSQSCLLLQTSVKGDHPADCHWPFLPPASCMLCCGVVCCAGVVPPGRVSDEGHHAGGSDAAV
jgi:hypothetical protein